MAEQDTSSDLSVRIKKDNRVYSWVWRHATQNPGTTSFKCNYCTTVVKYGNSSNLKRHLWKHHKNKLSPEQREKEYHSRQLMSRPDTMRSNQNFSEEKFCEHITKFLIGGYATYSSSFQDVLRCLRPDIPSEDTIARFIQKKFDTLREQVKSKISKVDSKISLSLDCWTSDFKMMAFIGVTAHWISDDWCMHECLLDFVDTDDTSHCGAIVSKIVASVIKDFELDGKILAIVTDTTTCHDPLSENMQYFGINIAHVRCFAHMMNRSMQDTIKCIADSTGLLRELIRKIEGSPSMLAKLATACQLSEIPMSEPILDVSTRWYSTYEMIKRAIKLRRGLDLLCITEKELGSISEDRWQELEAIAKCIMPFAIIAKIMSASKYPTLSVAVPYFNRLCDYLEESIKNYETRKNSNEIMVATAKKASQRLLKYFNRTTPLYRIASVLDPRVNLDYFQSGETENLDEWKAELESIWNEKYKKEDDDDFITLIYSSEQRDELHGYFREVKADPGTNVLDWWRQHENIYPNLSRMVRDYFSIPATAIPSEYIFSDAGEFESDRRERLNPKELREFVCLRSWRAHD